MTFSHQDSQCMALAMKLSMKGRSTVGANPMVGCVITIDGKVIAQDYHREYGKDHAEVNALDQIKNQAKDAIMYVTLEPCSHHFKIHKSQSQIQSQRRSQSQTQSQSQSQSQSRSQAQSQSQL